MHGCLHRCILTQKSSPNSVSYSCGACFSIQHSWERVLAGLSCDEEMLEMSSVTSERCRYVVYIFDKTKSHGKHNCSCATASMNVVKGLFSTVCQIQTQCMREKEYYVWKENILINTHTHALFHRMELKPWSGTEFKCKVLSFFRKDLFT